MELEERFYRLLLESQSPEHARAVLVEEAELRERAVARAVAKGAEAQADLAGKGGKTPLSQRMREAAMGAMPRLLDELRHMPGRMITRPVPPDSPGEGMAPGLPDYVGRGERLAWLYFGPLGQRIRHRQGIPLGEALGLYDDMRELLSLACGGKAPARADGAGEGGAPRDPKGRGPGGKGDPCLSCESPSCEAGGAGEGKAAGGKAAGGKGAGGKGAGGKGAGGGAADDKAARERLGVGMALADRMVPDQGQGADGMPELALWGLRCSVALAGARLMYFSATLGYPEYLWDLVMETTPVAAGPLASEEQAAAWAGLIHALCVGGQSVLAFAALDKLKSLPPFPRVISSISWSALEVVTMLRRLGRFSWERLKNHEVAEALYWSLQFNAPSLFQFERPGVIPYVPKDRAPDQGADSGQLLRSGFLRGVPRLWAPFDERHISHVGHGPLRPWPIKGGSPILDFHLDMCGIAHFLYSKDSVKPDLEEIEEPFLKVVNLIDYFLTNPYRLKAAACLAVSYAEFGQFEKAKFMHGVMLSVESQEAPLSSSFGPGLGPPIRPENCGESWLFAETKSEITMRLFDLFIAGRHYAAKRKGRGAGKARAESRRAGGPAGFPDAFDGLFNRHPKLGKVEELTKAGELEEAMDLLLSLGSLEPKELAHLLYAATCLICSLDAAQAEKLGGEAISFVYDRRFSQPYLKGYAAHNGLRIMRHLVGLDRLPVAAELFDILRGFRGSQKGTGLGFFAYGIQRAVWEAGRLLFPSRV